MEEKVNIRFGDYEIADTDCIDGYITLPKDTGLKEGDVLRSVYIDNLTAGRNMFFGGLLAKSVRAEGDSISVFFEPVDPNLYEIGMLKSVLAKSVEASQALVELIDKSMAPALALLPKAAKSGIQDKYEALSALVDELADIAPEEQEQA